MPPRSLPPVGHLPWLRHMCTASCSLTPDDLSLLTHKPHDTKSQPRADLAVHIPPALAAPAAVSHAKECAALRGLAPTL